MLQPSLKEKLIDFITLIQITSVIFGVGMMIYEWITMSGFFYWFAWLQAGKVGGEYELFRTLALTAVVWGAPLIIVIELLTFLKVLPSTKRQEKAHQKFKEELKERFNLSDEQKVARKNQFLKGLKRSAIIGSLICILVLFYGRHKYQKEAKLGDIENVEINDINSSHLKSDKISILGYSFFESLPILIDGYYYLPVLNYPESTEQSQFLLRVSPLSFDKYYSIGSEYNQYKRIFRGYLSKKTQLSNQLTKLNISTPYYLIDHVSINQYQINIANDLILLALPFGLFIFSIGLIISFVQFLKTKPE